VADASLGVAIPVGFYGKLPLLGDFVGRRVPVTIIEVWDAWMQSALSASREAGGEGWLDMYLTAPMWRFFAQAGTLHEQAIAGVVFPSVDRVGRCFPLTVFARLPGTAEGLVVATNCSDWFERVEDLVLAQFDEASLDLEGFDAALLALTPRLEACLAASAPQAREFPASIDVGLELLHVPLGGQADIGHAALSWLDGMIRDREPASIHWWSSGSARVRPSWLITRGLPEPTAFGALLSGAWQQWPWTSCDTSMATDALLPSGPRLHMESAGTTHPGKTRSENQDAWMARPDLGLWAVADGMGGHEQGSLASQMTRDALNNVAPASGFASLLAAVRGAIKEVNDYLFAMSVRRVNPTTSGTTIVALLLQGTTAVCVWAGDSRLYRLRDGQLEQLTKDHSDEGEGEVNNVITRAVGGHPAIDLDQISFQVRVGDRFLLCSDGLYRETMPDDMARILSQGDALTAVDELRQHVLEGRATDNLTAIVVDAQPAAD
jgi:type VI secretion system protein ImpM